MFVFSSTTYLLYLVSYFSVATATAVLNYSLPKSDSIRAIAVDMTTGQQMLIDYAVAASTAAITAAITAITAETNGELA